MTDLNLNESTKNYFLENNKDKGCTIESRKAGAIQLQLCRPHDQFKAFY